MPPLHRAVLLAGIVAASHALGATANAAANPVLRCQTRIVRAAERVVRGRQRALATCVAAPASRCAPAIARAERVAAGLGRAAARCAALPASATLGGDGIGWEALAPVCPERSLQTLGDVAACLEQSLVCVADVGVTDAAPEAIPRLAEHGIAVDRRCLAPPVCGDGQRDGDEDCDDGNRDPGDGCDAECHVEVRPSCGDGVLDAGEECDDGAENSDVLPDRCRTTCLDPFCGDGVVDPEDGEECDPPGTPTCDEDCFVAAGAAVVGATATPCDHALVTGAGRVTRKVQRQVGTCALALARCSLPADDPSEACLARAERRCTEVARRRAAIPVRLAARLARHCGESPAAVAARLGLAACAAEAAVSRALPRADELMLTELLDLDGDDAFPCVIDLGDLE